MGDYTAPPAAASCESVDTDISVDGIIDVPIAYGQDLSADVCLDVDLTNGVMVDVDTSATERAAEKVERRIDRLDSRQV